MNNKITVTGANILFFAFTILYFLFQIIISVLDANIIHTDMYALLLINQYVIILIPILIFVFTKRLSFKEVFRLNSPGIIPCLIILFCAVPACYVGSFFNTLVVFVLQFIGNIPAQPIPVPKNLTELFIGILVIAVSPAICEEMLHRGIMLKAYEKRGSVKAIIISAIIFGFFHFDITNLFGTMILGALIAYYVVKTNSIFAGMLAHFANNGFAELMDYLNRNDIQAHKYTTVSPSELGGCFAVAIAGAVILFFMIKVLNNVTKGKYIMKPAISGVAGDIKAVLTHWPMICVLVIYAIFAIIFLIEIVTLKLYPGIM